MSASEPTVEETVTSTRLAEVVARLRGDAMLQGWLELLTAAFSANLPICVTVDGQVFRGQLAGEEAAAAQLDATLADWLSVATVDQPPSPAHDTAEFKQQLMDNLAGRFTDQAQSRLRFEQQVAEALAAEWGPPRGEGYLDKRRIEELPADLISDAVDFLAPRGAFTLVDAELMTTGGWLPVGVVRVVTSHVGAWWVESGVGRAHT